MERNTDQLRSNQTTEDTKTDYMFAEIPLTWETSKKIAINISPKYARTTTENLWGLGISANVQFAPRWELIPEYNINLNSQAENNITLGLRWNASDRFAIEFYGSTASSMIDIGHLFNSEELRLGSRLTLKL